MTQGRFETLYNCRENFDERDFWAEKERGEGYHDYRKDASHYKQKESCPFHDLRADGCFQPERWGAGVGSTMNIPAEALFARKRGGKPFATSVNRLHSMVGCGGSLVPVDTAPGQGDDVKKKKYDARPWTSTRKSTDLFSRAPYMTVPPAPKIVPPVEPPFRTSKAVGALDTHFKHVPDTYGKKVTQERPAFRLKAGKVPFQLDPRFKFAPGPADRKDTGTSDKDKKKRREIPRSAFVDRTRSLMGTFSKYPEYVPTPYEEPSLKENKRPIFTYAAKTKRTMPVACTWNSGLTTAEPTRRKRPASAHV